MKRYFDPAVSHQQMRVECSCAMKDTNRFDAASTRDYLRRRGIRPEFFVRFLYRPFDLRWVYWEPETKLLGEKSPHYFPHVFGGNVWLAACQQNRKGFDPAIVCRPLAAMHVIERTANLFPLYLRDADTNNPLASEAVIARRLNGAVANLSDAALAYLTGLGGGVADAPHLFHHAVAVMHAPRYAADNGDALRQDWPRVPLPPSRDALLASADLGRRVAALLDSEAAVEGVTAGKVSDAMRAVGSPTKAGGGQLADADLAVTARWGITGQGGVTMPGAGRAVARAFTEEERAALGEEGVALLGPDAFDVYLNDATYWRNVPRRVWEYRLGGYQVLKKWLSYRERSILGRGLTVDEVKHVRDTARRIAALLLLGPTLDANYAAVAADPAPWPPASSPP